MKKIKINYLSNGKIYKGETHKTGSTLMTGVKHTSASKILTHKQPKIKNETKSKKS
jgi:hypothetical protein